MNQNYTFRSLTLPIFLNRRNKNIWGIFAAIFAAGIYMASNRYPIFPPQLLPMSWFDQHIPFLPITVWIYISEYLLIGLAFIMCEDMVNTNKYLYSVLTLQVVSVFIFFVWPTTYPRDLYPLNQETTDFFTYHVFSHLRTTDAPSNCAPSLHVSTVYLSSFLFLDEKSNRFPWFFAWATCVALSTLSTKQHYVIDVFTGFLMAVTMYWMFHRILTYKPFRVFAIRSPKNK